MSGQTGPSATVYVDVATQTYPFTSLPPISPACPASPITSFLTATSLSNSGHSRLPIQNTDTEDTNASSNECMPTEDSCEMNIVSSRRPSFPSSFSLRRKAGMRTTHTNIRTVSLPETLCDENLHLVLSQLEGIATPESPKPQPRVVSMPVASWNAESTAPPTSLDYGESNESSREERHLENGQELAESSDSVASTPSTPRTVVMHSLTSDHFNDHFNTPSPPPSSCDSVEFTLEDPVLLPDSFLRGSISPPIFVPEKTSRPVALLEDDGWITWANSPPRPIPALHGPSSLPYARCPSGAEGTIIEEQSSMPRMIWGLDPNDTVPGSQVPHHQSRAVDIKPPVDMARRGLPSSMSTPVSLQTPSSAPRYGFGDSKYHRAQDFQSSKRMPAVPARRIEERSEAIFRGMTTEGTGLGFLVAEDQVPPGAPYHLGFRSNTPQFYPQQAPERKEANDDILPIGEEIGKRQMTSESWNEKYSAALPTVSREHSSDLIDLFSRPIKAPTQKLNLHSSIASAPRAATDPPGYLPTPPNSSSPQWSPAFSPVKNSHFSTANFATSGSDLSTNFKMLSKLSATNDELSHELRRFVFSNMPANSSHSASSFGAPQMTHGSPVPYSFVSPNLSFVETPIHPPGIPIPDHILLSQVSQPADFLSAKDALPGSLTPPSPSTSTYRRSSLSNPRSVPLSRLRQNQKRDTTKLATVPEEDFETPARDKWLVPPAHNLLRLDLRTPSPLPDRLRPQSVEEKADIEEEVPIAGTVRVKLPDNRECRAGDVPRDSDSNQTATPQGSPKKKRLQRRRKPANTKSTENSRGFPLISEGTVSFGSSDVNKRQEAQMLDDKPYVSSSLQSSGSGISATRSASTRSR